MLTNGKKRHAFSNSLNILKFNSVVSDIRFKIETIFKEGRKEMFYLTTHSTHFIYGYIYGQDHSDSEKGNPLPPHRLLFPINSKGSFICTIPQTG